MSDTIKKMTEQMIPLLKKCGVVRSALFGSFARGEETDLSDIDVLVEFNPNAPIGLFDFIRLKNALQDKVRRKVDLVTYEALHPLLRDDILAEQKVFYEQEP